MRRRPHDMGHDDSELNRDEQGYIRPDWLENRPEWMQFAHQFLYAFYYLPKRRTFDRWNSVERLLALNLVFPVLFAILLALTLGLVVPIAFGLVLPVLFIVNKITDIVGNYQPLWVYILSGIGLLIFGAPLLLAAAAVASALLLIVAAPILAGVWIYENLKATADLLLAPGRWLDKDSMRWGFFAKLMVTIGLTLLLAAAIFSFIVMSQGLGVVALPGVMPLLATLMSPLAIAPAYVVTSLFAIGTVLSALTAIFTVSPLLYCAKNTIQHGWRIATGQKEPKIEYEIDELLPLPPLAQVVDVAGLDGSTPDPSLGHTPPPFQPAISTGPSTGLPPAPLPASSMSS